MNNELITRKATLDFCCLISQNLFHRLESKKKERKEFQKFSVVKKFYEWNFNLNIHTQSSFSERLRRGLVELLSQAIFLLNNSQTINRNDTLLAQTFRLRNLINSLKKAVILIRQFLFFFFFALTPPPPKSKKHFDDWAEKRTWSEIENMIHLMDIFHLCFDALLDAQQWRNINFIHFIQRHGTMAPFKARAWKSWAISWKCYVFF